MTLHCPAQRAATTWDSITVPVAGTIAHERWRADGTHRAYWLRDASGLMVWDASTIGWRSGMAVYLDTRAEAERIIRECAGSVSDIR
jgi:hypothetical protein